MRIICKQTLLWLGVCLLAGVVSGWAQQAVVLYQLSSVPTTVASTGDSEVLGSVRFQVTNVSDPTGTGIPAPGTDVLAQGVQIVLNGISCDNNFASGVGLSFGTSAATPVVFSATNVIPATGGYDVNNSIVPGSCVIGINVNIVSSDAGPAYGLPNVGDWFQVDGIRARMEFSPTAVGGSVNASALLSSSVGSGEITAPNSVQVASPFTVLADSVTAGVYINCLNGTIPVGTITVQEPYQADFVDYTIADVSNSGTTPFAPRPLFGATDSGTEILFTVGNVPAGVTLTFPGLVSGNVAPPAGAPDGVTAGDHLVLASGGTITGPVTSATVLYSYTCYSALACDTVYETFAVAPLVTGTVESTTGTITIQAQVVPLSTPVPGGVPSFTTPPNTVNLTRPRWSDTPIPAPALPFITLAPCSTTLLFPWVVDVPGFDTGVIINNTTQDYTNAAALPTSVLIAPPNFPFVTPTTPEAGTCTLYYFPSNEAPALYQTSPMLSTGQTWSWIQSSSPFAGLTGYMMARCNFQFGHGYAAIGQGTSVGSLNFTEAYLGLVIPDPVILGSRVDAADGWIGYPNTGEGLDH
jgi:hypothetical protein